MTCDWRAAPTLLGQMLQILPQGATEEDYPFACTAGLLGSSSASDQASFMCGGLCPAGKLCPGRATIDPIECHILERSWFYVFNCDKI